MQQVLVQYNENLLYALSGYSLQVVLLYTMRTYSIQWVLTLGNIYKYFYIRVLTSYNKYLLYKMST